jgi:hypothetical protein
VPRSSAFAAGAAKQRGRAMTGASAACERRRPVKTHVAARPCDPGCTPPDGRLAAEHGPRRRDRARRPGRPACAKHAVRSVRKKDLTVIPLKLHANSRSTGSYWILPILLPIRRDCAALARRRDQSRSSRDPNHLGDVMARLVLAHPSTAAGTNFP